MKRNQIYLLATAAFFIVSLLTIGTVIRNAIQIQTKGVECRFECQGYDPYDPIRGRYIRIYPIVRTTELKGKFAESRDNALAYYKNKAYFQVAETPGEDGLTKVLCCSDAPTSEGVWFGPVKVQINRDTSSVSPQQGNETFEEYYERLKSAPLIAEARMPDKFYVPERQAGDMEKKMSGAGRQGVAIYHVYRHNILLSDVQPDSAGE